MPNINLTAYNNLGNKLNQAEAIAYFLQESNQQDQLLSHALGAICDLLQQAQAERKALKAQGGNDE